MTNNGRSRRAEMIAHHQRVETNARHQPAATIDLPFRAAMTGRKHHGVTTAPTRRARKPPRAPSIAPNRLAPSRSRGSPAKRSPNEPPRLPTHRRSACACPSA